jgi:hypothetical protein
VSGAGLLDFPQLLLCPRTGGPKAALMQMLFWRNNIEDGNCHSPELFTAPEFEYPGLSFISYVKPIRENRKIRHENEILKAKEPAPYVWKLQIYRMVSKNICVNLVRLSL